MKTLSLKTTSNHLWNIMIKNHYGTVPYEQFTKEYEKYAKHIKSLQKVYK